MVTYTITFPVWYPFIYVGILGVIGLLYAAEAWRIFRKKKTK